MAKWNYTCDIKQHMKEFGDLDSLGAKEVRKIVNDIKTELSKLPEKLRDDGYEFSNAIEVLDEAANTGDVEVLDDALEQLYDWADDNRVWLGI